MKPSLHVTFLSLCTILAAAGSGWGEGTPNKATLTVGGQTKNFSQFVVIRGKLSGEPRIMVIASMQPLSAAVLKEVSRKEADESVDAEVDGPYVKGVFSNAGELTFLYGHTERSSFGQTCGPDDGSASIEGGRIKGNVQIETDGTFARKLTWTFDLPLDAGTPAAGAPTFDPPVKPTVSGTFVGNGKNAKLGYVTAVYHEPFSDRESVTLVFTEKDPGKDTKPQIKASFGHYGSALIISVNNTGGIFGCEVAHSAHEKSPFAAIGSTNMEEFDMSKGNVKGHITTNGEVDTFDQKWQIDLSFAAPLPAEYRVPRKQEISFRDEEEDEEEENEEEIVATISVMDVPLPKNAADVNYSKLVKQVKFNSASSVSAVTKELSAALRAKGWAGNNDRAMGVTNAILKGTKENASVTIMVKPAGTGSTGVIFSENLKWDDAPDPKKAARSADLNEKDPKASIRSEVKRALDEAGGIPKEARDLIDQNLNDLLNDE